MGYLSVAEIAKKWGISERSVRNYCSEGRVDGAFLTGKTWNIPEDSIKPDRRRKSDSSSEVVDLYTVLKREKETHLSGGIYHKIMISLTYNSNHMEGSLLSEEQTRYIFETKTIASSEDVVLYDDVVETANHFRCIDYCIENAKRPLSETMIKEFHRKLKTGTTDADKSWFAVGGYKKLSNTVGDRETAPPDEVGLRIRNLLSAYNCRETQTLEDIVAFHVEFERIHPFQDGNGRVGRLIMFKECLKNDIVPFIIDEGHKSFYYRGLTEWNRERGYLLETCRACQDVFKGYMDYFGIPYRGYPKAGDKTP